MDFTPASTGNIQVNISGINGYIKLFLDDISEVLVLSGNEIDWNELIKNDKLPTINSTLKIFFSIHSKTNLFWSCEYNDMVSDLCNYGIGGL